MKIKVWAKEKEGARLKIEVVRSTGERREDGRQYGEAGRRRKKKRKEGKKKKKKRIGDIFFWFTCPQRIGTGKTCASCIS